MDDGSPSIFSDSWWEDGFSHATWSDANGNYVVLYNDWGWVSAHQWQKDVLRSNSWTAQNWEFAA